MPISVLNLIFPYYFIRNQDYPNALYLLAQNKCLKILQVYHELFQHIINHLKKLQ